jgi:tetratricopeptide (TPR) repeat protein
LRLVGERELAQSRLDRAQTMSPRRSAESLRVEALLVAQGAGQAGLTSARDLAAQAVAADGNLLRARLLLARASLAAGDGEAARREAEAVLAHDGTHAEALALRDRAMPMIAAGGPPTTTVPPTTAPPTTAPPATAPPSTAPPTTTAPPSTATPTSPPTTSEGGGARDYSGLVREGEARLERGSIASARQSFEAALRARPGGTEAVTGLGYVMLNEGNAQGAARQFQTAANNGNSDALIGLGDAYRRLGQREQALEAYRRYVQILPSGSHASVARRQIDALGGGSGGSGGGGSSSGGGGSSGGGSSSGGSSSGGGSEREPSSGGGGAEPTPPPAVTDTPAIESEP